MPWRNDYIPATAHLYTGHCASLGCTVGQITAGIRVACIVWRIDSSSTDRLLPESSIPDNQMENSTSSILLFTLLQTPGSALTQMLLNA